MKIAPIWKAMLEYNTSAKAREVKLKPILVHTGQHYDANMSEVFFKDLGLPEPHYYLGAEGGTHAEQTAKIIVEFEKVLTKERPGIVGVVGDVNSTLACALTTAKSYVLPGGKKPLLIHVEAGLRSGDRSMPEEINRIVTDAISDVLFTTEESGNKNLIREGVPKKKIYFVGNVMIDSLLETLGQTNVEESLKTFRVEGLKFGLVTLHRPANVDQFERLKRLMEALDSISREALLVFPVHPRTMKRLGAMGWRAENNDVEPKGYGIRILPPLGYRDFVALMSRAVFVITDSGGIQEEATVLNIPCLTLRRNTERPITIEIGTNKLVGNNLEALQEEVRNILNGKRERGQIPPLWDGQAARRIISVIANLKCT